ncbi:MAG TPA: hypothetical protein PLK77_16755 [Pyrinomonadaceae bacterium]|nr:hypothetical protein [Pyrinomonadaceae bacterium]
MRAEYDFSNAVRGKYFGRVRIVGPVEPAPSEAAKKLRRSLEADLRKLGLLDNLGAAEKKALRKLWDRKLEKALAD